MTTSLVAVCLSAEKGIAKTTAPQAELVAGHGIRGDAHAGPWHRQVSALDAADIEGMRAEGLALEHGAFGENLVIEGLDLAALGIGSELLLGRTRLVVTQIGKRCHNPCAIFHAVGRCIMPERGLFMAVATGGTVRPGDEVQVVRRVPREVMQVGILTVSDRAARGERADASGPALRGYVTEKLEGHVAVLEVVADEREQIADVLRDWADRPGLDVIVTTGGTGLAPRDVTPEATRAVIEREVPGLAERMRAQSVLKTPNATLSRAIVGVLGQCLIINLPGSPRGAVENLEAIAEALPHAVKILRGKVTDCAESRE